MQIRTKEDGMRFLADKGCEVFRFLLSTQDVYQWHVARIDPNGAERFEWPDSLVLRAHVLDTWRKAARVFAEHTVGPRDCALLPVPGSYDWKEIETPVEGEPRYFLYFALVRRSRLGGEGERIDGAVLERKGGRSR